MPRPSSPPGAKASTRCPSLAHAHAHPKARAGPKPRHAQEPSTASTANTPKPRQSPRSTHTQKRLERYGFCRNPRFRKVSPWGQTPLAQPPTPRSDTQANPPRTTPASFAQTLARPGQTRRVVPRVQNAPEPDSQSIKNTKHRAEQPTPPRAPRASSAKPRPTAVAQPPKPKPQPIP